MRPHSGLTIAIILFASSACAGGLDIGAEEVAFNPCDTPLPSREDYLRTVVGPDGDAVYDMQKKYHAWLCDGAAPAIFRTPMLVAAASPSSIGGPTSVGGPSQVFPDFDDDDKLHFVFPGSGSGGGGGGGSTPSPVPLPASGLLLLAGSSGLGLLRAFRKNKARTS